jgi:alkylation response protein AidB-like acyl-CoA dehydrogenase
MMKKRKQRWNLGLQTSPEMNQILNNHADWLDYNVSKVAGNECRRQAIAFVQKDLRQKGVRKHDRSNKMGDRSSPNQE